MCKKLFLRKCGKVDFPCSDIAEYWIQKKKTFCMQALPMLQKLSLCVSFILLIALKRERKKNCNINHMVTVNDQLFMWNDFILKLEVYNTLCNVYYLSIYIRKHIEFTIIYTSSDQLLSIVIMSEDAYFIECFDKKL